MRQNRFERPSAVSSVQDRVAMGSAVRCFSFFFHSLSFPDEGVLYRSQMKSFYPQQLDFLHFWWNIVSHFCF